MYCMDKEQFTIPSIPYHPSNNAEAVPWLGMHGKISSEVYVSVYVRFSQNWQDSASQYRWITAQNILWQQPKIWQNWRQNKQQLTAAGVKARQSISRDKTQHVAIAMVSRLREAIKNPYSYKCFSLSNNFWAPENEETMHKNGCDS